MSENYQLLPWNGVNHHLYMDESGELGQKPGSSKFFLICLLSTKSPKALKKRIAKAKAELYNLGWPKDLEIKGTSLWGAEHQRGVPAEISTNKIRFIRNILSSIAKSDVKLHYIIVNKNRMTQSLKQADYGIAFNYYSGMLLTRAYSGNYCGPVALIVDQRNKETHKKKHFDGYVETKFIADLDHCHPLKIEHRESHDEFGLQAVDFMSWALFRYFEHDDGQFLDLMQPVMGYVDNWYAGKRCPGK